MSIAHGVPTIRYKVYAHIKWPGLIHEFVWCGHEHYNENGATRCALKYYNAKARLFYAPLVHFVGDGGLTQITTKGDWKPYRGVYTEPTRVLTPEQVVAEMKARGEARDIEGMLK